MKTPHWFLKRNIFSYLLCPLSIFYYLASRCVFHLRQIKQYVSKRPIICFGNILSGGVGKTPIVRQVAKFFDSPVVMRGYKKSMETANVGDEAKMLANDGILVHVGDRKSNLILLNKQANNTPIIMDDGFQNSSIKKDISILVFDSSIGFGNGFILPAGPLRETRKAISRADAIIVIKKDKVAKNFVLPINAPIFFAVNEERIPFDKDAPVLVFAGIGYPEKFFNSVKNPIVAKRTYPDHYQYTDKDIKELIKLAQRKHAKLLTTEKDWVRLPDWAKEEISFSALDTKIESGFYTWLEGKINDISNKEN